MMKLTLPKHERGINILELSQKPAEIYASKKLVEQRRHLLCEIFSNLTLDGKSLDYAYTETVEAVRNKEDADRKLKNTFELDENGLVKQENEYMEQAKTIWLGR